MPSAWLYNEDGRTPNSRAIALTPNGFPAFASASPADPMISGESSGDEGLGMVGSLSPEDRT